METRVCPKCGEEKKLTAENWYKDKSKKTGFVCWCKRCVDERVKQYRKANPDQLKAFHKRDQEKNKERTRKRWKKAIELLNDMYIKNELRKRGLSSTPELIELKRQQILAKRLLKKLKQWREANESNNKNVDGQQCDHGTAIEGHRGSNQAGYGGGGRISTNV